MPTQIKKDKVVDLQQRLSDAGNIFVTDYAGLNVAQITKLRKDLRESGVKYFVAKNTLMRLAASNAGMEDMLPFLEGPVAIAVSNAEPNVPAKILYDAFKEFKEIKKPEVKVFYIDNQQFGANDISRMAELPTKEVLLSMLVASVEGPITNLVGTLDGIIRELVGTIDAIAGSKDT